MIVGTGLALDYRLVVMLSGISGRIPGLKIPWGTQQWHAPPVELEASQEHRVRQDLPVQLALLAETLESPRPHPVVDVRLGHARYPR